MALTFERVGYTYGSGTGFAQPALEAVTAAVAPAEVLVVLGPTGSGKSTLLRLAAGLMPPTSGAVLVDGDDRPSPGKVGLVFQEPEAQLFAETVLDDVGFGPRNLGMDEAASRRASEEALEAVGLPVEEFSSRSPFGLSGGEARRAALAGVIAMRPAYLLLDEPSSGLDAEGRARVRQVVAGLRGSHGIVIVTHDAEEFLPLADRVLLLSQGRQVFLGSVPELLDRAGELFPAAGLLAPEVVRAQLLALERGAALPAPVLDPVEAAGLLLAAAGGAR